MTHSTDWKSFCFGNEIVDIFTIRHLPNCETGHKVGRVIGMRLCSVLVGSNLHITEVKMMYYMITVYEIMSVYFNTHGSLGNRSL